MLGDRTAKVNEGPHDIRRHLNGARTIQYGRSHDGAVFRECDRRVFPMATRDFFKVAICDLKAVRS